MADRKLDVTPQEPAEEIGDDTPTQPERPAQAPDPQPEEPTPFPPAGHRSEQFDAVRPDGTRVTVTRDIDTGERVNREVLPWPAPSPPSPTSIWRTLDGTDKTKAQRLLAAASRKIRRQCPSWAQADEAEPGICKDICCNMVKRAMVADETNPEGLSQGSQTTGPFADSWSYSNPNGDLYLTSSELADLDGAGELAGRPPSP